LGDIGIVMGKTLINISISNFTAVNFYKKNEIFKAFNPVNNPCWIRCLCYIWL